MEVAKTVPRFPSECELILTGMLCGHKLMLRDKRPQPCALATGRAEDCPLQGKPVSGDSSMVSGSAEGREG